MCATFAYFTASVQGNDSASSVIVKTAQVGTITFADGDEVKLENALPGQSSEEKEFTIKSDSTSNVSVPYTIKWVDIENTIGNDELLYTLTGTVQSAGAGSKVADVTDGAISTSSGELVIGSGTIAPGETHKYTLKVTFKETYSDQSSNQNKSFSGKINVTTGDAEGNTYYNASNPSGTTTKPSSDTE